MKTRTFSFLECFVLLMLVAAVATVAVPQWTSDRILANEREAVRVLRKIAEAQAAFHARNGTFGMMEELAGFRTGRDVTILPAVLPTGQPELGVIERDGYLFAVYLAARDGQEAVRLSSPDPGAARTFWVGYAWPAHYGITGRAVFGITSAGQVFSQENSVNPFTGRAARPPAVLLGERLGKDSPLHAPAPWVKRLRWVDVP